MINKENCRKLKKDTKKSIVVSLRITPEMLRFVRKNKLSPTEIFREALRHLGFK